MFCVGYVISLVPPQSYFDVTSSHFDLSLLHSYSDYHPEFHYRGLNSYAILVAAYGQSVVQGEQVPTFDMVMVQVLVCTILMLCTQVVIHLTAQLYLSASLYRY